MLSALKEGEGFADEKGGTGEESRRALGGGGEGAGKVGVDGDWRGVWRESGLDVPGCHGAGGVDGDEVDLGAAGEEVAEDAVEVLGLDHPEDEAGLLIAEFLPPGGGEGLGCGGVVGDVEDEGW